ncbi:DNA polymerase-3 subunit epsilon [Mucilaginibacter yixingensis]|uniref:DNA polymerase-3 subunit epsilon n=1 Tax=Mucilaginibacter yixingensis TaxID=1295612 RepID=A0A2T5J5Q7_9SPHI|nr:3'-5' exonuclease [Mucilaginibacter yixingensis]PTQ93550.1 DNA polymerase-3 subunit epsilon [Mucilaginibacter yixingensis]
MNDYLLFIDTEASGLPQNWSEPLTNTANWPNAVQVAWVLYDKNRNEVKRQNHYISNNDFTISADAQRIHGLTVDFLATNGESRAEVLKKLTADIEQYKPMLVGHFLKLDYYVLSADYNREEMANPMDKLPMFCTMLSSRYLARNPMPRQMRLDELYSILFRTELQNSHQAQHDAEATARCFFELQESGEINSKLIREQNADAQKWKEPTVNTQGCFIPALMLALTGIIIYLLI